MLKNSVVHQIDPDSALFFGWPPTDILLPALSKPPSPKQPTHTAAAGTVRDAYHDLQLHAGDLNFVSTPDQLHPLAIIIQK